MDKHRTTNPLSLSRTIEPYDNRQLAAVNDHEIRMSVMEGKYRWHSHPDSDETFLSVDGELLIELEDGSVTLRPGDMFTVPAGVLHRTRALTPKSVNLTFERKDAATVFPEKKVQ
jgi:mannose-6-phosphate isomerase-like protein (cupin superfamily)